MMRAKGYNVLKSPTGGAPSLPGDHSPRWALGSVLALNVATGIVEAICLGHLGGVFAAYVTGTLILAGVHLGTGGLSALTPYGVAFAGFVLGSLLGGRLTRAGATRGRAYTRMLLVEGLALALAAVFHGVAGGSESSDALTLSLLAVAMAVQFSATRHLNLPNLRFAAATGLVHGIGYDTTARGKAPAELPRRLLAVATLVAGAALGAVIGAWNVPAALALAALTVLVSATSAWFTVD